MAMSEKDYILIAASIKKTRDSYQPNWDANLFRALDDAARDLATHSLGRTRGLIRASFCAPAASSSTRPQRPAREGCAVWFNVTPTPRRFK